MPRTLGQHFLMHSVENSDVSRHREADSFDDAKKRHDGPAQQDFNPERDSQNRFIRKYAKRQQQGLGGQNLDDVARANQQQNPDRTQENQLNAGDMLNAPPQMNRQGQRGQFGQINQQDRQQFDDRQRQDFDDDEQQDFDNREQGFGRQQGFNRQQNFGRGLIDRRPEFPDQDQSFGGRQQDDDRGRDLNDDDEQGNYRQQFNERQQGSNRREELDENRRDFSDQDSFRELGSSRQQNVPSQNKLDLEVKRQARAITANEDILGNEINEEVRNKLPTAAQPKTELTGGKNPWELSDTSPIRRELRDTRIFRDKYNSEEEMHEEGRRQIEARRIPEDVIEGRPSPSNVGRILLLPRPEINGNWRDGQMKQLAEKAGGESVLNPGPLAIGHRKQAQEDNKFSLQKRGLVRQTDLENKLQEMGEPGRTTTMQEALRWQRNLENMTPEQRAESDERRQREEAGDNKSSVDRIAHDGWRVLNEPGKMYTQSKEGKEKMEDAAGETQEKQQEAPKKLSPQEERKEKMRQAHLKHRAFYEELERRRHGMTPLESLDFDHEKQTDFDDQQQTDLSSLSGVSIEEARARVREDELKWRDRQREGLGVIQRIQKIQELEEQEGQDSRKFRDDKKFDDKFEDKFKDQDDSRDEHKSGMLGNIKNFASHKWHDLTHGKEDKKQDKQKDDFWGRNERNQNQQLNQTQNQQQQLRSSSPTTPVSPGRRLSADSNARTEDKFQSRQEQPAKKGWWFFGGNRSNLQHFAPEWNNTGKENTRFIDSLTDDELSMMSL